MARPNIITVGGTPAAPSLSPSLAEMIGISVKLIIVDALNRLWEANRVAIIRFWTDGLTVIPPHSI